MGDRVTVSGTVEAPPRVVVTDEGLAIASFRVRAHAGTRGRVRLPSGSTPGCYLVTAVDDLARGVAVDVRDGDRVVVGGALILREGTCPDDVVAEVHAEAIGLDVRLVERSVVEPPESRAILS